MTRHEAVQALQTIRGAMRDEGFVVDGDNISTVFDRIAAVLSGPIPDPATGLVPCGCGGKAEIGQYCEVTCDKCGASVPANYTEADAKAAWNTAMGWKGGAEPDGTAPNGDKGAGE